MTPEWVAYPTLYRVLIHPWTGPIIAWVGSIGVIGFCAFMAWWLSRPRKETP